jgi:cytochrome oxidase Cu insertion factor (SCO1/SenC/PrrC family)
MLLQKFPTFTLTDLNGQPFSTDDLLGKKTLLFMWASW